MTRRFHFPRLRGFTLIELLIVVAIIAILAAIAIPNFLEAQTRSKVSRAKADMRSLATAIEAYRVDTNRYPPDYGTQPTTLYSSYLPRLVWLSTPIAYITAIPEDPFAAAAISRNASMATPYHVPYPSGPLVHPFTFDYAYRITATGQDEDALYPGLWTNRISRGFSNVMWAMKCVGPDLEATVLGATTATTYDPTNGTISTGDIFLLGPGLGFDAGPVH